MPVKPERFKKGTVGAAFKNRKFYLFSARKAHVIRGWPDPLAWLKLAGRSWRHDRERTDSWFSLNLTERNAFPETLFMFGGVDITRQPLLPFPPGELLTKKEYAQRRDRLAKESLLDTIPDEVRTLLLPFKNRKWHLLCLFARCPGAVDLGRSNPALAYALASNWVFRKPAVRQPIRAARGLVRRKQKDILRWLGFPGTEPVRRITAKIVPEAISINSLLYLRSEIIQPETRKSLSHLPRINAPILRLATDSRYQRRLTPCFLEEISQEAYDQRTGELLHTLRDTLELAEMDDKNHCPPQFSSHARLVEIHDFLDRRLRIQFGHRRDLFGPVDFPPPPFMGTKTIRPILTEGDLAAEGEQMDHCVGAYAGEVAAGNCFVYRVLDPVRATLSLRQDDGKWRPDELYQHRNQPVEPALKSSLFRDVLTSGPYSAGEVWDKNQLPLPFDQEPELEEALP